MRGSGGSLGVSPAATWPTLSSSSDKSFARKLRELPACASVGAEIDFRWVADAVQASQVSRYELAREVFLVADALLQADTIGRKRFRDGVASGVPFKWNNFTEGWPIEHYELLLKIAGSKRLERFDLAPAAELRGRFRPTKAGRNAANRAVVIGRVGDSYDRHDVEYGPDAYYELIVSRIDQYGIEQAVREFRAWAEGTGYFDLKNPGGRPPATLLHLAYFRFTKGPVRPKSHGSLFAAAVKSAKDAVSQAQITDFGMRLFDSGLVNNGVSAAAWSEGVAHIGKIVMPAATLLASHYLPAKR